MELNFSILESLIFNNCKCWGEEEGRILIYTKQIRPEIQKVNCKIVAAVSDANAFFCR